MRGVGCPCIHCLKVVSLIVSPPPRRNSPAAPRLASTPKYCWPTSWAKPVATCMPGRISRYRMHNSNVILNSSRAAPPASPSPTSPASANSGRCRWSSIAARSFDAPAALRSGGWLLLEHGYDQGAAVHCLLTSLDYRAVATHRDHADNDRVTLGRRD